MAPPRSVAARNADALPGVEEAIRDFPFPLAHLRVDPKTRCVILPFEKKHPRRESWELVVRGARSVTVKGRLEQASDYFRALRHDRKGGALEIEAVIVKARIEVESLDVEARCLTPEEENKFDVADLPREVRKEIEARESASLKGRERYEKSDRERLATLAVCGTLGGLVLGAGSGMPPWLVPLDALLGGAAAWWLARKNLEFPIQWAGTYGAATIVPSFLGILLTVGTSEGAMAGFVHSAFWCMMALTGFGLAFLNGKMSADVQGLSSAAWDAAEAPAKPLDRRIPLRAAALIGGGGAILFLLFGAPWQVWAVASPFGAGGLAWLLARFQIRSKVAGRVLGAFGALLAFMGLGGGLFLPAAIVIGLAHFPAGLMVAYYSRGEGPR